MEDKKITLNYILSEEEMNRCADLVLGNKRYSPAIIRTVILILLMGVFTSQYIYPAHKPNYQMGIGLLVICVVMIVFSWVTPGRVKIKFLKDLIAANDFTVDITEEEINLKSKNKAEIETIKMLNISVRDEDDLYILTANDGGMIFIPKRAIADTQKEDVSKILTNKQDINIDLDLDKE